MRTLQEHRLHNTSVAEFHHALNDFLHTKAWGKRAVHHADVIHVDGVELEDIVINLEQCIEHIFTKNASGITQHTDFGFREKLIAKGNGVMNDVGKAWVHGGLPIASKSDDIGIRSDCFHFLQLGTKCLSHFCAGREFLMRRKTLVVATLAIDAIE